MPVRVTDIEEKCIRNPVSARPTFDVVDIACGAHQIEKIDDVERIGYPERRVVQTRAKAIGEGHVMHAALAVHPGGPDFAALIIFGVFGHAKPDVIVEGDRRIDI